MTPEKSKNVTTDEMNLVVKYAKLCIREMAKKEYELRRRGIGSRIEPVTVIDLQACCRVRVKYRGQRSYGSFYGIKIDIKPLRNACGAFYEYNAYNDDPVIGGSEACGLTYTPKGHLLMTVAHEVSHYLQHQCGPHTRWLRDTYRKPHGHGFQSIYRKLRSQVVNPTMLCPREKYDG
mgnify:CR=1 FL=1|tara:strand:- start:10 stop:540 length:531 start_codon:yes stop_codon:yes gene_type:complete